MKTPRFYLSATVLFWGWQTELLWIAICIAAILESASLIKSRFDFKPTDFNKFIDISTLLLAGTIVIALTIEAKEAIFTLLKWLPLIFLPIITAQLFSTKGEIDIQSFFFATRKKKKTTTYLYKKIDFSYIYSFFCIISAGSANRTDYLYYCCVVILFIWALWQVRSKRNSSILWIMCIFFIIISGYAGYKGMRLTSIKMHQWAMEYYSNYYNLNPFKTYTALGEITKLKLSDKIIFRTSFEDYTPGKTYLLHNASYNKFNRSNWFVKSEFTPVEPDKNNTSWQINPAVKSSKKMTAYFRLIKERAVLSLPPGVVTIAQMKTGSCEKNTMQSVRIEDGPSLIKSVVSYTDKHSFDAKPYNHDFLIPKEELLTFIAIAQELDLLGKSDEEILKHVKTYFLKNYTYSLDLKGKGKFKTPLQNFLNNTKAGHCEFFATATALVLREAGIPTRYATGYIAHEYSKLEGQLIVRQRDAHAWVKVFINGQWINFDTTPPSFLIEDQQTIDSSLIKDFFSFLGFKLSQLKNETGAKLFKKYGFWLILPLCIILFFRLKGTNRIKRIKMGSNTEKNKKPRSENSSFYLIEQQMAKKGFPRHDYETCSIWLERIDYNFDNKKIKRDLQALLCLHNKKRFSKSGLKNKELKIFQSGIKNILINLNLSS